MANKIRRYRFCHVERSPYFREVKKVRDRLEATDYSPHIFRQHMIRIDQVLRAIGKPPGATYSVAQLDAAFSKHNETPAQLMFFRSTQRHYQAYLASEGRLKIPLVTDRFAGLRGRYHQELCEVRGFAPSTVRSHDATVSDFLQHTVGSRRELRSLRREDIDHFLVAKSRDNSRHSLQHIVAALRSFLRYCHDHGVIASRLDAIDTPRTYRGELLPRALDWHDIQVLLRSIDRRRGTGERDYTILHLMAHYGLRPSEIIGLRLDSIGWRESILLVEQRKTRSDLVLPLNPRTIKTLQRYIDRFRGRAGKYPHLFLRTHCPYRPLKNTAISEMFSRRAEQAGLGRRRYTAYSLRHGFAMRLLGRGVGVKAIGDVLGHRDLESTCVYLRLDAESLRVVALPVPRLVKSSGGDHAPSS